MRLRSAENKSELQPGYFAIKNADQSKLIEIKPGTKKAPRMGRLNQVFGDPRWSPNNTLPKNGWRRALWRIQIRISPLAFLRLPKRPTPTNNGFGHRAFACLPVRQTSRRSPSFLRLSKLLQLWLSLRLGACLRQLGRRAF